MTSLTVVVKKFMSKVKQILMMPEDLNKWYVRNNSGKWFHSQHLQQANGLMVHHV
jgi:hypothetical protein